VLIAAHEGRGKVLTLDEARRFAHEILALVDGQEASA
jgi:hypothetical protein